MLGIQISSLLELVSPSFRSRAYFSPPEDKVGRIEGHKVKQIFRIFNSSMKIQSGKIDANN